VYGPNVMQGYHNRDEENRAVFTPAGGFRTGDLGYLDSDGFLYITGRLKEQYKLENGKYVAPVPLEEQLKLSPYVANAMVFGDNRLFNVAVIVPDMEAVKKWAGLQGATLPAGPAAVDDPRVVALIRGEVDRYSADWKGFDRIERFTLTAEDFTTDNGLLTPTLKLKRRVACQVYAPQIEALYAERR
jgi:long-chain acyl-CoA synthetase